MKIVQFTCPNCNANLRAENDRQMIYCEYCGKKIILDDGIQHTKHTRNVIINKQYTKINESKIREAEIQKDLRIEELKAEDKKDRRDIKILFFLFLFIVLCIVGICLKGCLDDKKAEQMEVQGLVSVGYSSDFVGEKYKGVVSKLKALGFENIETIDLDD